MEVVAVNEPLGNSSQGIDDKIGIPIEQQKMSVDFLPSSAGMDSLSPVRSFRPFQGKRIDSQNTASTAETSHGSFDSFVLKSSGDSFLSHEPDSPAAYFAQSYNKIVMEKLESKLSIATTPPPLPLSGLSPKQGREGAQENTPVGFSAQKEEPIMEPSGAAAFFDDSYRKLEKRRSGNSVDEEEPMEPSGAAAFFDDSFRKIQNNRSASSLNEEEPSVATSVEDSHKKTGHRRIASEGKAYFKESYQKYAKLAKVNSVGARVGDGDGKEEPGTRPSGAASCKESYRKYAKLAPGSHENTGISKEELAVKPCEVEVRPETEEPKSAQTGAAFFADSYNKLVQEKKLGQKEGVSTVSAKATPQLQHGVSDSKLVTERGVTTSPRKMISDSNLIREKPNSQIEDSSTSNPYQQLKRFMREGMGRVPDDRVDSMAETRLTISRQASSRASIRASKVGSALISRKTIKELEAAAEETSYNPPGGLVMPGLSDDESLGQMNIGCDENMSPESFHACMNTSGHNIDMSGRVGAITPPRSQSPKADPPSTMKMPVMVVDAPSREPSDILFQPLQQQMAGQSGGGSSSAVPVGLTTDKRSSVGAAELFEQFHASTIDPVETTGLQPGAFSARGLPTGDSPHWSRDAAQRLQPPQNSQWASWGPGQHQRRRRSSFQNWIRRRSNRFSRRDLVLDGPLPEDVAVGVPATAPSIDTRGINNERPAARRSSFFIGESARRLIGLRVLRGTQRQQAPPPENMSFNPVSLELEPIAGGGASPVQPAVTVIAEKKRFRRIRKLFSQFGRWGQHAVNAFVKYT